MAEFEKHLALVRLTVERFVKFKISSVEDAEDVLQEIYMTAWQKFGQLKNADAFKAGSLASREISAMITSGKRLRYWKSRWKALGSYPWMKEGWVL